MLRLVLAITLVSCAAPTTVVATPTALTAIPSTSAATRSPAAAAAATPTPDAAAFPGCLASQLRAVVAGAMAADEFVGAVFFANRGGAPCTLRGTPELVLLATNGSPLDLRLASVSAATPARVVVPVTEFQQSETGLMGFGATAPLRWSNYCDDASGPSTLTVYPLQEPVR